MTNSKIEEAKEKQMKKTNKLDINIEKGQEINIHCKGYIRYITIFEKDNKLYINYLGKKRTLRRLYEILDNLK